MGHPVHLTSALLLLNSLFYLEKFEPPIQLENSDEAIPEKDGEYIIVSSFHPNSRERTRETYYFIFIWEIAQGRITGYDLTFSTGRTGRYCYVGEVDPSLPDDEKRRIENSLNVKGAKLFNMLPKHLRDYKGDIETFSNSLYDFLSDIPDNPKCPYRQCKDDQNSLLKLIPKHKNIK